MTGLWRDFDVKEKRKMKHNWGRMWVKGKFLKTGSKESSKKEDSGGKKGDNYRTKPGSGISPGG